MPPARIESPRVKILHRRLAGRLGWGALAALTVPFLGVLALASTSTREGVALALGWMMLLSPVLGLAALVLRSVRFGGAAVLSVSEGSLRIRRGRRLRKIPLGQLAQGFVNPTSRELTIELRGGDRITTPVWPIEEGQRLLEAAGLDASKRTMKIRLGDTTFPDWMTFLLGPIVIFPLTMMIAQIAPWPVFVDAFVFAGLFLLLFGAMRALIGPAEVNVGADGVVVHQGLRDTFVPYEGLDTIIVGHRDVRFVMSSGRRLHAKARQLGAAQRAQLQHRLDDAIAAWRKGRAEGVGLGRLDRRGRSAEAWRSSLRGLLDEADTYREARLPREEILRALESPAMSAERRLAAAMALSSAKDPEAQARIRIAAQASANPHVRIALEKLSEGLIDDAAVEEAIAEDLAVRR